jgi:hypothetical protein
MIFIPLSFWRVIEESSLMSFVKKGTDTDEGPSRDPRFKVDSCSVKGVASCPSLVC